MIASEKILSAVRTNWLLNAAGLVLSYFGSVVLVRAVPPGLYAQYAAVLAIISLSLALLNLLPLPPLDGGHIAFSIVEGLRGRAVGREVYERVSVIGIALVLFLFFIGVSNDINRLGGS